MSSGYGTLPWWVDALLILIAVAIVVTLVVLVTEVVRWIAAGAKSQGGRERASEHTP